MITIISIFAEPASILFPPVPIWHRRSWFTLCLSHHALQIFSGRFPLNCHTINQSATCHSAVHCPTAVFSGIAPKHTFSGSRSPVAVCQRAALLIGLPALLTAAQVSYRVLPASGFHGRERPSSSVEVMRRHRFRLHDRRASSTFSGPFRRCWVAGIVSFHSHRNLQDLNLRSLPLSVKRRIPPRPRLHMSPSFRGVILHWWPVIPPVGPLRAPPSGVSVRYYLIRRFFLGLDVACTWRSWQPTLVPHGGCDPPARISGLMRSCGIFRRYFRHGRGRVRRGKRSMEYAFILGRMCTCLLHIFFAPSFIIPQYLVFVNQISDFYINILCFQELSNALRTISCI